MTGDVGIVDEIIAPLQTGIPPLVALIVNRSSRSAGPAADITGAFTMAFVLNGLIHP
jgi:hypothetical protein